MRGYPGEGVLMDKGRRKGMVVDERKKAEESEEKEGGVVGELDGMMG
jgi:hypothetical protein